MLIFDFIKIWSITSTWHSSGECLFRIWDIPHRDEGVLLSSRWENGVVLQSRKIIYLILTFYQNGLGIFSALSKKPVHTLRT